MTINELENYCKTSWLAWFFLPANLKLSIKVLPNEDSDYYVQGVAKVCIEFEYSLKKMGLFKRWLFKDIITRFSASETYKTYLTVVSKQTRRNEFNISQQESFSKLFKVHTPEDYIDTADCCAEINKTDEFTSKPTSHPFQGMKNVGFFEVSRPLTLENQLIDANEKGLEAVQSIISQNSELINRETIEQPLRCAAKDGHLDIVRYFVSLKEPIISKKGMADALEGAMIGCQKEVLNYLLSLTDDYAPDLMKLTKKISSRLRNLCRHAQDCDLSCTREENILFLINLEGELKPDTRLISSVLKTAVSCSRWDVVKILIQITGDNKPDAASIELARSSAGRARIVFEDSPSDEKSEPHTSTLFF